MGNVRILAIKVLLSGFIIALVGCSTSRVNDGGYKQFKMPDKFANDAFGEALPSLPERLDDRNDPYIARIGFPRQGDVRVWVKHPDRGEVELYSGNPEEVGFRKKLDVERLYKDPEFGTSLLRLREDVGEVTVRFLDQSGQEKAIRTLRPKTKEWLEDSEEPYSIAFYGCYAPFTPQDSDSAVVFESENPSIDRFSTRFEQLMAANALGEGSGLLPNLKLVVGTGDQVYVDLGYEFESPIKKHPKHPTSGWNTEEPPRPRSRP